MDIKELKELVLKYPDNSELGKALRKKYYETMDSHKSQNSDTNQLDMFNGSK